MLFHINKLSKSVFELKWKHDDDSSIFKNKIIVNACFRYHHDWLQLMQSKNMFISTSCINFINNCNIYYVIVAPKQYQLLLRSLFTLQKIYPDFSKCLLTLLWHYTGYIPYNKDLVKNDESCEKFSF